MSSSKTNKSKKLNAGKRSLIYPDANTHTDNMPYPNNPFSQTQFPNQFQQPQYPNQYQNQYSNPNQNMSFPNNTFNQYSQPQFSPTPPFSNYSTHPSQPSQYHNQYNSPTPNFTNTNEEEGTDAEADDVGVPPRGRVQMFTQAEDILLAEAYVRISENPVHGTDQKHAVFWDKITTEWNETAAEASLAPRAKKSLGNRFSRMKTEMVMYNEAISFVNSHHYTGINEAGQLNLVQEKYKVLNNKYGHRPFSFSHVVDILNRSSKFNYSTTKNRVPRLEFDSSSSNDDEDASGHASTNLQPRSGDKRSRTSSQDVSSPSRPMGSKAAKNAEKLKKKGKSVCVEQLDVSHDLLEAMKISRIESREYKMQMQIQKRLAFDENREIQERMLALKEKKLAMEMEARIAEKEARKAEQEAKRKDQDLQIIGMDPNTLPNDEAKLQLAELKSQIMARWVNKN